MQIGDLIHIIAIPEHLPDDEKDELKACFGQPLNIMDMDDDLVFLDTGLIAGKKPMQDTVWISTKYVAPYNAIPNL